jgi:RHS repeat-associated protein
MVLISFAAFAQPGDPPNPDEPPPIAMPDGVKIDTLGRQLSAIQQQIPWGSIVLNAESNVFPAPPCLTGDYFVAFQLVYDLGNKNTTVNWSAKANVELRQGTTMLWNRPVEISMSGQNFVSTIFHSQAVACAGDYRYRITAINPSGSVPTGNVYLKILLFKKRADDFNPALGCTVSSTNTNNQTAVGWTYTGNSATEFDVEWVFVANYETLVAGATGSQAFDFRQGQGAGITTTALSYNHPTFYPAGRIFYRVRAVGYRSTAPGHRIVGAWGYGPSVTLTNPQSDMTWQAQTVFSEEGKYKKTLTYFDPSLRQRQIQTNLSSNNTTVVGETLYDFEGRAAANMMPVPTNTTQLTYKNNFNTFTIVDGTGVVNATRTSGIRKKFHYDNGRVENSKVATTSGAGYYYSASNTMPIVMKDYLPNADGYVYSQTEFQQDVKGFVSRESMVGQTFKMDGSRAMRNYYVQASTTELLRLFGSNAGNASHYKKQITVDHNGQATVAYVDQSDRTIATALAGTPPTIAPGNPAQIVDPLASYQALPAAVTDMNISAKNKKDLMNSVIAHKIFNEAVNTQYTFTYSLSALSAQVAGFNCQSCVYNVNISITDPDGKPVNLAGVGNQSPDGLSYQRNGITTTSCSSPITNIISFSTTLPELGDYTVTKTLSAVPLTLSAVETMITASTAYTAKQAELNTAYTADPTECATCTQPVVCNDAYQAIESAVIEVANQECTGIRNEIIRLLKLANSANPNYEPTEPEITGHATLGCQLALCNTNLQSDIFDKHLGRITTWAGGVSVGFDNAVNHDPFFNISPLSGVSSKTAMVNRLDTMSIGPIAFDTDGNGTQDGSRTLTGTIQQITDPTNTTYYINDRGLHDPTGVHVLFLEVMSKKSTMTAAEYAAALSEAHWTLYRTFYMEEKRKTKLQITAYQNCLVAKTELEKGNLPTTAAGITSHGLANYTGGNITTAELDGIILMITNHCKVTLTPTDRSSIVTKLTAYFNANPTNFLRHLIDSDMYVPGNLSDVRAIVLAASGNTCDISALGQPHPLRCKSATFTVSPTNRVVNPKVIRSTSCSTWAVDGTETCFPNWAMMSGTPQATFAGEVELAGQNCTTESEAVRGRISPALEAEKLYRLCFKYRAVTGAVSARISLSTSGNYAGTAMNFGGGSLSPSMFNEPFCGLGGGWPSNMVRVFGQSTDFNSVYYGGFSNTTYQEHCVYFTARQASTYFYIVVGNTVNDQRKAMFKDFSIQEATAYCTEYEALPSVYNFTVDWGTLLTECNNRAASEKTHLVNTALTQYVETEVNKYYNGFNCVNNATETFVYTYQAKEYHYTLYYYDQAGNLVQTVPPAGVVPLPIGQSGTPNHSLLTRYRYNSQNQLTYQSAPDAGTSEFWYNNKSQLRMSRNAQQAIDSKYSYSKYDPLGRIAEAGVLSSATIADVPAVIEDPVYPLQATNTLSDITWTYYDVQDGSVLSEFKQLNVRNRLSYTVTTDQQNLPGNSNNLRTHYSYDIHGNVRAIRQKIPGLNAKKVRYVYDFVSNKATHVFFEFDGQGKDQFSHRYTYDADNRLTGVYTSSDKFLWHKEAGYSYYAHGPLARIELGEYRVQGQDYYYTLQGWIKGVNMPFAGDPGGDGIGLSAIGKDATAYTLGYFQGDYAPINTSKIQADSRDAVWTRLNDIMANAGQYNGNISWMITDLAKQGDLQGNREKGMQAMVYKYDQLNRLTKTRSLTSYAAATGFTRVGTPYDEDFSYDANGNLKTLQRRSSAGALQDDFNYQYYTGTNKLMEVKPVTNDLVISSGQVVNSNVLYRNITIQGSAIISAGANLDIKATNRITVAPSVTIPSNATLRARIVPGTYEYNAVGNFTLDKETNVSVTWTPQGKVRQVSTANSASTTTFRYDASGNRVEKKVVVSGGATIITRYLRDANGSVLSIYNDTTMIEQPIYGSSRVGTHIGAVAAGKLYLGRRQFELTNHLGNVLSLISDRVSMSAGVVTATVSNTSDYYAFGSAMSGRTWTDLSAKSRYGFNGKEKDADSEWGTTAYDYGFRIYNPTIGKFLSVDPLTREYPWYSPYQFAGNMPIWAVDLDGAEPLVASNYKTLTDLKSAIKMVHYKHNQKQTVMMTNSFLGMHVIDVLVSGETSQEDLKKARDGGFWAKTGAVAKDPSAAFYKNDLEKIEKMSYRKKNDQKLAFQDIALLLASKTINPPGGIDNTYLHVAGQAFITALFGEGAANYSGHLHEAAHESLFTGVSKDIKDEQSMIDNYADLINNQWGQAFGKQIMGELDVSGDWTNENTADFLNKLQDKLSETMGTKFSGKHSAEDEVVKGFTKLINENK